MDIQPETTRKTRAATWVAVLLVLGLITGITIATHEAPPPTEPARSGIQSPGSPAAPVATQVEGEPEPDEPEEPPQVTAPSPFRVDPIADFERTRFVRVGQTATWVQTLVKGDANSAGIAMKAFDIDVWQEVELLLNGKEIALPRSIYASDRMGRGVTDIPLDALRDGENVLSVTFRDNLGGNTRGFTLSKISIELRGERAADLPTDEQAIF